MQALPQPPVLFGRLQYEAKSEGGAREAFQSMITDLVTLQHPTANEVAGPGGGDWGIDTYTGRLDSAVVVWQSKFFLSWTGDDQRKQVRQSFNQLTSKAASEGFTVSAWTLCVPCILPPKEQQWFDDWAARQLRDFAVRVSMWNGRELRRRLMQPDAEGIYEAYFLPGQAPPAAESVEIMADVSGLGDALFVRQLEEAGQVETDAARGLFFAAEALARSLAAAGNRAGVSALDELHLEIQSIWEGRFNLRVPSADASGKIAGLIDEVMDAVGKADDPEGLRLRPSHRRGIAHRLVEDARAGWVRHWREVATDHQGASAKEVVAAYIASGAAAVSAP